MIWWLLALPIVLARFAWWLVSPLRTLWFFQVVAGGLVFALGLWLRSH